MVRAIFRPDCILLDIKHLEYAALLSPEELSFRPGGLMLVAVTRAAAQQLGTKEYVYLYHMGEYQGEDKCKGEARFGRPRWKHWWTIQRVDQLVPFSLEDVAEASGGLRDEVLSTYRGGRYSTDTTKLIAEVHRPFFRALLRVRGPSTGDLDEDLYRVQYRDAVTTERARGAALWQKIRRCSERNVREGKTGPTRRFAGRHRRDPQLAALLARAYDYACQVCGKSFTPPGWDHRYVEHHHVKGIATREGTNHYKNILVVCPTCHKKLDTRYFHVDHEKRLLVWAGEDYQPQALARDEHFHSNRR